MRRTRLRRAPWRAETDLRAGASVEEGVALLQVTAEATNSVFAATVHRASLSFIRSRPADAQQLRESRYAITITRTLP